MQFLKSGNKIWSVNGTWKIFFFKSHAENEVLTSFCLLKRLYTKDKRKWLKLQVSRPETQLERDISTRIFMWISHIFFQKPNSTAQFTEQFWMNASADSSTPTKVLSHLYDHTVLHVFPFIIDIVGKGIPASPPFLRHPPLDPDCPVFKIFVFPLLFSVPPPFKVF